MGACELIVAPMVKLDISNTHDEQKLGLIVFRYLFVFYYIQTLYGCYFHFCQAIYDQIQHSRMHQNHSITNTCEILCKKVIALRLIWCDQQIWSSKSHRLWHVYICDKGTSNVREGMDDI